MKTIWSNMSLGQPGIDYCDLYTTGLIYCDPLGTRVISLNFYQARFEFVGKERTPPFLVWMFLCFLGFFGTTS